MRFVAERATLLAVAAAILYGVVIAMNLSHYGITWDAPENFEMGERYFLNLVTGDAELLDLRSDVRPRHLRDSPGFTSEWSQRAPQAIWPVANVLSAASFYVLSDRLGVLGAVDGHHWMLVPLAAFGLWLVFRLARDDLGPGWALFAAIVFATWPRFFGHAHTNIKDVPLAVFFLASITFGVLWVRSGHWRWVLPLGLSLGAAIGTRPNAVFVWIILGGWIIWRALRAPAGWRGMGRPFVGLGVASVIAIAVVGVSWPLIRVSPPGGPSLEGITRPIEYLPAAIDYIRAINQQGTQGFNVYAPTMLTLVTPAPGLLLVVWGLVAAVRTIGRKSVGSDLAIVTLLWIALTILRTMAPWGIVYDGVRHFLELVPAMAILAAFGARDLVGRATARIAKDRLATIARVGVLLAPVAGLIGIVATHPYETTYFSFATGGLRAAQARNTPFACDYWASSYRNAARWLSANAEPGAIVNIPVAGHLAPWIGLREDLVPDSPSSPGVLQVGAGDRPVYLVLLPRRTSTRSLTPGEIPFHRFHPRILDVLTPVHEVTRQGGIIVTVYRADAPTIDEIKRRWPRAVRMSS